MECCCTQGTTYFKSSFTLKCRRTTLMVQSGITWHVLRSCWRQPQNFRRIQQCVSVNATTSWSQTEAVVGFMLLMNQVSRGAHEQQIWVVISLEILNLFWNAKICINKNIIFLVACTRLNNLLCLSVGWLVGWSVTLYFFFILFLWPHCSCPNDLVASNIVPAHPHATLVAVYPALFLYVFWVEPCF